MKVDRIILALTANPLYTDYWNFVSEIWATKFNVIPTLIFNGTANEMIACNLSKRHGQILRLERVPAVTLNLKREWACTWSRFYAAALFESDTCMICDIDQVPLNGAFFDKIKTISPDKYVVGLSDAYFTLRFPASYHVGTGSLFKGIYDIDSNWEAEVTKIFGLRDIFEQADDGWGLDESYSSWLVMKAPPKRVVFLDFFRTGLLPHRLDRGTHQLQAFDFDGIAAGRFTEWHGDRPFPGGPAAQRLLNSIPKYLW